MMADPLPNIDCPLPARRQYAHPTRTLVSHQSRPCLVWALRFCTIKYYQSLGQDTTSNLLITTHAEEYENFDEDKQWSARWSQPVCSTYRGEAKPPFCMEMAAPQTYRHRHQLAACAKFAQFYVEIPSLFLLILSRALLVLFHLCFSASKIDTSTQTNRSICFFLRDRCIATNFMVTANLRYPCIILVLDKARMESPIES